MADATTSTAGRKLNPELAKVDFTERGVPGTPLFAGIITADPNRDLQGVQGLKKFQQMSYDPTCAALIRAVTDPIRATKWFVEPADDDPLSVEMADFVHHVLWEFGSQSFDDIVRMAVGGMLTYGFNVMEIIYQWITDGKYAGKVGWDKLAWRSQLTKFKWNVEEVDTTSGGRMRQLVSMTQQAPPSLNTIDIPRDKLMLWVHELTGENFDGTSALRPAYQPWYYKDWLCRIEAIGLERAYMGIPRAKIPEDFSDKELAAGRNIVQNLRTHESAGIVHPTQIEIDVLFNKLEGTAMREAIHFHDGQIPMSYLASFLKLGSKTVGSYALSEDQSDLFLMAINGDANYFAQVMNQWPGIEYLLGINYPGFDAAKSPHLSHGDVGQRSLDKLARGLALLTQVGMMTPDDATEDKLRDFMELPQRDANLQPEAMSPLIEGVMPPDWIPGMKHTARLGVPPPTKGPESPIASPSAGGLTQGGAQATKSTPLGNEAKDNANAANLSERKGGRLVGRGRTLGMAMDALGEYFSEQSSYMGTTPDKPSIALAKRSRPYVIRPIVTDGEAVRMSEGTTIPKPNVPRHRTSRNLYTVNPAQRGELREHFKARRAERLGSNLGDGTTAGASDGGEAAEAASGIAT